MQRRMGQFLLFASAACGLLAGCSVSVGPAAPAPAVTIAPAPVAEEEILRNPGFEEATTNWVKVGNAKNIDAYDWHHHEGKWSWGIGNDFGPENAFGELAQELRVPGVIAEGDLFVFSVWMQTEDLYSGTASLAIDFLGPDGGLLKSCRSEPLRGRLDWTNVTVIAEAPEGAGRVVVRCTSTNMATGSRVSFVWFDDARIDCPVVTASSTLPGGPAPVAVMRGGTWHSRPSDDQWILIDSRTVRPYTGLSIGWDADYARDYEVLVSADGRQWTPAYGARKEAPGADAIYLAETRARFIRIDCNKSSTGNGFGLGPIRLLGPSDGMTMSRLAEAMAEQSPACYPRWLLRQEAYWTGVGVVNDDNEAILCEDGTIEPHKRGFTIMPFLYLDDKLITRDDAQVSQSLEKACLPIPTVAWNYRGLDLSVKLFASGETGRSIAYAWYRIRNSGDADASGRLFLTFRPFQIYPPWQGGGGFAPITNAAYSDGIVTINDKYRVCPLTGPAAFGAIAGSEAMQLPFKIPGPPELRGDIMAFIKRGAVPEAESARDAGGFTSAVLAYDFKLSPGGSDDFFVAMPLHDKQPDLRAGMGQAAVRAEFERMLAENIAFWEPLVNRIRIEVPDRALVETLKANIAFSFVTKDGPAFQPGSRSYDKAWMRDGGMSAAALLRMGFTSEIRDFIDWYSTFQFESGEIPPIIDTKEEDPLWEEKEKGLIEYDSQGEYVYTVLQYYLFTRDRAFLESRLTNVVKALEFLAHLRSQTMTPEFRDGPPEKHKFYGILPPSTSHEGYGREYSCWDDFWALRGWKDGRTIFSILGRDDLAAWAEKEYADFKQTFYDSIRLTMELAGIDFIPGSISLADFDATSTAVALMYCGELDNLPQPALQNTFDRYYKDLQARSKPGAEWRIVPYELRSVPAFLLMGQKARALELLRFMIACRRPTAWNQLAEVVHSDYRFPTYVGDMPHTWVGAEYLFAVRTLFAYERGDALVLGAGIDPAWLEDGGHVAVEDLPTEFGRIAYEMRRTAGAVTVDVRGDAAPPGGFIFRSPLDQEPSAVAVNGLPQDGPLDEARLSALPATVEFRYGSSSPEESP